MDMYTLLYLKWITNKDLLYITGNSARCYMVAWMGRESGGEWIPVHVWLSCSAVHSKLSHVNQLYSNKNKKFFKKQAPLSLERCWGLGRPYSNKAPFTWKNLLE